MSFCDISFNRTGGSVTDVLNKEGRESALYPQLVSYVQQDPQTVYNSKKEYFDTLVDQGKLIDKSTGFKILNNAKELNLPKEKVDEIFNNYVNLMDRKREGKAIDREKFQKVFDNLQVFVSKNTYIFGEWDSKNNIFKGRLMSSSGIKELYGELDTLLNNTNFMASVPEDIGRMLEKKGLYKLNVDKPYNFRGEDMIKNLYFSNKELVEKVFKKNVDKITYEEIAKYDEFFNYWSLISKLKNAYVNKQFDKMIPILKEMGIYDYNAYRLVKKAKSASISNEDIESIVKDIIKNSAINKVTIDKTDILNNPKVYEELNNDLNKTLATYLSKFGIKTELLEDIQSNLGVDSLAHVDLLNKILYVNKNNQEQYPQAAGKLIAYMMQHNPLISEIKSVMKSQGMFKGVVSDNEALDAIGDLISEELHKRTKTEMPKSLLDSIRSLIRQFFDFLVKSRIDRINKNVGIIAENILAQNQSLITQSTFKPGAIGKPVVKVRLQEALDKDAFSNSVVEKMSEFFILTGSVTLAEQGTIYRPNENQVHDLDWVSTMTREEGVKIFEKMYPNNKYIRNIYNAEYQTDTWLIAPEGYTIKNLVLKGKNNQVVSYDIVDKNNKVVSVYDGVTDSHSNNDVVAKAVDIFSYEKPTAERTANKEITLRSGTKLKIADWRNIFKAKLEFARLKDLWDYNRFIPEENIYKPLPLSTDELSLGLYSIAYNSGVSEQEFMDRINRDGNLSVFGVGDKQSTKRKKEKAAPDSTEMFLKDTVENGLSKENQLLAKRLSSIPGFKNVTVEIANIPQYVMYNKAENKIQVSQVAMETVDPIAFEKAILNTVMESIADNMLTTNRNALRSNQKFYGYISDMVKDLERRMPQEMKDMMNQPTLEGKAAAFISQYMSNPELREWSNKRIGDKKNFWNQLSNFVATNLFDKKILETSMYEFLSELENIPTVVAPAIINNVLANNTQKVEQLPDYSSLANIYGDLSFFDSAKVRIKEQINMEDLKNKVAAVNRFYGGEVLSLVETKDGTELRFSSSNLNKLIENGKKFMEKKREDKNKMELSKEVKKEARMVDTIPELSFLTEEQKEEAERLLKSNEFNLQCGL